MQHFYNGYLPNFNSGASSSSSSTSSLAASDRTANTGSSLNISFSDDLNPYLQQTLNKLPVALNSNIPYLQHSMIAFANRIPYQTSPEVQTNNPNLAELLDSIGSDFRLDQNKSNEVELICSGSNGGLSEGQLNPADFTELPSSGTSTISSSMSDAFPASQTSSSLIQAVDEKHLTGVVKTTISDSSVQKPPQTKRERAIKAGKHKPSGSSTHGGGGASSSASGGVSAQDLDKAISLTNNGFRNMSLKGIYYDRRNHGWQVRIRKRQTEISRYFSAKRYGVEKSYEMALRFYQVNIIGNFGNESKLAKNFEISRRLDGKSDIQVSKALSKDDQNGLNERQVSGQKNFEGQIANNSISAASGGNIFKNVSTNSRICNNSINGSLKSFNTDSASFNGNLNNLFPFSTQGDLDVSNQLLSHYITNNILNNILVNQIIANNLFANTMMNVRNAVNLQGTGLPIHCFSKVAAPQTSAQQYGSSFATYVNSPNIVPSTPIVNPSIGVVSYNNDSQLMLKDIISNALSDSESLWKGIYYDNRNKGWKLCLDGYVEKFFGSMEFGEVESLALALTCKLNAFKFNCDISQIHSTVSNNINVLQKVMTISNEASNESPLSDNVSSAEDDGKKAIKNLLDLTLREKMDSFSLSELTEFISISQQIKQIINNSILKSGYQTLSSVNYNGGIPLGQPITMDTLKHHFRQPILNNLSDNSVFLQGVNNNQSLLYGQFLLNNQNQFGM
ncbi:AP2 domain-containing [Cryptosporidium sp. chipmunk genotype I]|uniref:AP2 domain-containing n=1 Tax=Cryptosporidium sp. chipmunk genotype I TaxID=1280935 RepID=UPI003519DDFF|nr:AP2 domain-containing [Cryptosporidium sp. chipmunk genotype I]